MDSSQENYELTIKNKITYCEYHDNPFIKIKLYQQSHHSSPNSTSRIILNEIWQKNHESLDSKTINKVLKSAQSLIRTSENIKTWKSSLSEVDSTTIFEKSIACCKRCILNETYAGFDQFINNKCKCASCILCESKSNRTTNNETKFFPQKENSSSCQPVIFGDEQKLSFKPKFRPKHTLKKAVSSQLNVNSDVEDLKQHQNTDLFNIGTHVESSNPSSLSSIDREEEENKTHKSNVAKITFKTAKEALLASNPGARRTLGASRKAQGKFVSPMIGVQEKQERSDPIITDDRLKHIDPKMIELIESEIIDNGTPVDWDDIAGLEMAKSVIQEAVVWPLLRPDIFTGLRRPPRGILLFGPPGTGKTLIGKCVAAQCNATFFSISASSLTSKWLGDGEKMVRALFAVASCHQPAVIFIDEIDSLLTQRSDSEHEATRRIKTEFLVQFDGAATGEDDRLLIVGATNRPQELDEAARRRLVKRLYIPLPDSRAREQIITNLLRNEMNELTQPDIQRIASLTEGYSGADMKSLCSEAAMGPIRSVPLSQIVSIGRDQVRPVNAQDFINALQRVRPSVSQDDLGQYVKWNKTYGQGF